MKIVDFKAKTKRWNHFAKTDTLGSFDFYTSIISLDALLETDILNIRKLFPQPMDIESFVKSSRLTSEQYHSLSKVLPLAAHEYTHFIDSTSTLWGLRHLGLMNQAYLADDKKKGNENDFYKAKQFYEHVRGIRLPSYYTVTDPFNPDTRPWQSKITIGRVFSSDGKISTRTVLFSRFSNFQGDPLVRSPISTISILEASAMAQEMLSQIALIVTTDNDFKIVEQAKYEKSALSYLYNREITEYSVCVHVLANLLGCKDAVSAFRVCALLTRLVLNFPKTAFDSVAQKCPISTILNTPPEHDFNNAIMDGIKSYDLGVIYYLLCCALPKNSHESKEALNKGILSALSAIGVDLSLLLTDALDEARVLFESMQNSSILTISKLAIAGYENFKDIGLYTLELDFKRVHLPPALLGDSSSSLIFGRDKNLLATLDIDECFNELFDGQLWVERFSEACL